LPALAGLLTAFTYVVLRTVSDIFYAPLGLSPEEVGLDRVQLLGRAFGSVLMGFLFAAYLILIWMVVKGLVRSDELKGRWRAIVLGSFLVSTVFAWAMSGWFLMILLATALVLGVKSALKDLKRLLRWAAVVTVLLSLLSVAAVGGFASLHVQFVERGQGLAGLDRLVVPWEATVATVGWTAGSPVPREIDQLGCGVYLGASGPWAFFYDPAARSTFRFPVGNVIVRTYASERATCTSGRVTLAPRH
jgi:hypothetical protein